MLLAMAFDNLATYILWQQGKGYIIIRYNYYKYFVLSNQVETRSVSSQRQQTLVENDVLRSILRMS